MLAGDFADPKSGVTNILPINQKHFGGRKGGEMSWRFIRQAVLTEQMRRAMVG